MLFLVVFIESRPEVYDVQLEDTRRLKADELHANDPTSMMTVPITRAPSLSTEASPSRSCTSVVSTSCYHKMFINQL